MRLPTKFGVSLPTTIPLPSASSPKRRARSTVSRAVVRPGHELEELHVPDGIEEVHYEKAFAKPLRAALDHVGDPQAARVRGDDRRFVDDGVEACEERALGLDLLHDGLDDEVAAAHPLEVVFDVADRHEAGAALVDDRGGSRLQGLVEAGGREAIASAPVPLLRVAGGGRHDVQQEHLDARVREVRCDAAAHDTGADDRGAADLLTHVAILRRRDRKTKLGARGRRAESPGALGARVGDRAGADDPRARPKVPRLAPTAAPRRVEEPVASDRKPGRGREEY